MYIDRNKGNRRGDSLNERCCKNFVSKWINCDWFEGEESEVDWSGSK